MKAPMPYFPWRFPDLMEETYADAWAAGFLKKGQLEVMMCNQPWDPQSGENTQTLIPLHISTANFSSHLGLHFLQG